jgi:hypothetical protein
MTGPLIVPPRVAVDQTAGQGPFLRGACGQGRGERGENEASGGSGNTGLDQPLPAAWCPLRPSCLDSFTPGQDLAVSANSCPFPCPLLRHSFCSESGVPTWIN